MPDKQSVKLGIPNDHGTTVIGLISDTHGLLRPEVLEAFQDVTGIIHAGDVGRAEILESLRKLAPTVVVRGNIDTRTWANHLPPTAVVAVGKVNVYIYHGHEALESISEKVKCQVVVTGHSHRPVSETREGVLYLNPGSAGPKRFKLPVTLMRIFVTEYDVKAELVLLA